MAVKAKFRVTGIRFHQTSIVKGGKYEKALARQVDLSAVGNSNNEEDNDFWSATPSGSCMMVIANPDAAEFFELDGEYYMTFDKAKDGTPLIVKQ